jgi:hypothetical protein
MGILRGHKWESLGGHQESHTSQARRLPKEVVLLSIDTNVWIVALISLGSHRDRLDAFFLDDLK